MAHIAATKTAIPGERRRYEKTMIPHHSIPLVTVGELVVVSPAMLNCVHVRAVTSGQHHVVHQHTSSSMKQSTRVEANDPRGAAITVERVRKSSALCGRSAFGDKSIAIYLCANTGRASRREESRRRMSHTKPTSTHCRTRWCTFFFSAARMRKKLVPAAKPDETCTEKTTQQELLRATPSQSGVRVRFKTSS